MDEVKNRTAKNHQWFFEQSFSCANTYEQFINWLQYEFCFLQQEQDDNLTLYFPNGQVQVKKEIGNEQDVISKISLESKCQNIGLKMKNRLSAFLDHVDRYHRLHKA